ncbi:MAG TPA: hypothetical protein VD994_06445, partial [Prosthecobacter sp.]|nr:hypothetical protein [Prosthecobacter sp.]
MANWADQILGTALQQRRRAEDAQAPPAIPQEAPPASIWDAVKRRFSDAVDSDAAQNTKTAVIKGGSATVGLLGDVPRIAEAVSGEKNLSPKWNDDLAVMMALSGAPLVGAFPSSEDIQRWVFSKTPEYQPKTKGEKLFQNVVAGATSGLLPGAGVLGPITGAAGAAGSTVAEELFPDSKWAPLLGGLAAGGGALGAYNLVRPSNSKVAKSLLAGIDESELDNAAALTRSSVAQGMGPLTPGEALRNAPMLQMQSMVEASAEGAPLRRVMAERGPATFKAIEGQLNGMLPGSSPTQGMTAVQGAGKKHIGNLRDKAEEAAGPLYEKSFADARPIGIDTRPILGKIRQIGDDNPSVRGTLDGLVKSV